MQAPVEGQKFMCLTLVVVSKIAPLKLKFFYITRVDLAELMRGQKLKSKRIAYISYLILLSNLL